jgi:hypothetical protein
MTIRFRNKQTKESFCRNTAKSERSESSMSPLKVNSVFSLRFFLWMHENAGAGWKRLHAEADIIRSIIEFQGQKDSMTHTHTLPYKHLLIPTTKPWASKYRTESDIQFWNASA